MKKIIASILAVFFVLLSPLSAYASTTESMLMYASVEDEYSIMPLSFPSTYDITFYTGIYNRANEQMDMKSYTVSDVSNGSALTASSWQDIIYYDFVYNYNLMPLYGFSLGTPNQSSSISIPDGSTLSFEVPSIFFNGWDGVNQRNIYLLNSNAFPYRVFADMHFTAMKQVGNTHSGTYHDQTVELTQYMNASNLGNTLFDINIRIPIQADQSNLDENIDRLYNINLRYIKVYAVYDFQNSFLISGTQDTADFVDGGNYTLTTVLRNQPNSNIVTRPYFTYSGGNAGDMFDSSTNAIQASISNLAGNVSNQVQQVKTQISQSTNTITTKIDTMSTNIQQGLQNVVQSAQQNTQNIINTVTQKVDEVKTGITEVKDSILDLPNKIQEMLLGLIVPDSDTMADKYSEFSGLLEEKLGVIYQIPMMLFDFFDTIVNAATTPQTTLTLPAFQLPWIDGSTLTVWQPMEYKIIPDGMQVLSDLIKTITSMTVVVLTFNSVKRAYERFLRS